MPLTDTGKFYLALKGVEDNEFKLQEAKDALKVLYPILVEHCPHTMVADWKTNTRGLGTWRICKICGLEDHALIGATSGDEYNYGYPGYIDYDFWGKPEVEEVSDKKIWDYRKSHTFQVVGGKVVEK